MSAISKIKQSALSTGHWINNDPWKKGTVVFIGSVIAILSGTALSLGMADKLPLGDLLHLSRGTEQLLLGVGAGGLAIDAVSALGMYILLKKCREEKPRAESFVSDFMDAFEKEEETTFYVDKSIEIGGESTLVPEEFGNKEMLKRFTIEPLPPGAKPPADAKVYHGSTGEYIKYVIAEKTA